MSLETHLKTRVPVAELFSGYVHDAGAQHLMCIFSVPEDPNVKPRSSGSRSQGC